jgi:hypothetical protein
MLLWFILYRVSMTYDMTPLSGVGIPVPIGYDDIQDIETWPILQSFALDAVYCPTGFFTASYQVGT